MPRAMSPFTTPLFMISAVVAVTVGAMTAVLGALAAGGGTGGIGAALALAFAVWGTASLACGLVTVRWWRGAAAGAEPAQTAGV